ncbi:histidine kinase [Lentzea sp. NBRC 102530]|uniref:sensor histidine kinase n=1 Tax=Lentzea sp. NBRC 102530 TaxID=3032201 RepID=UPI0024A5318F|nr:histidine kinase [Lentzea sp. NBRC 102530]GLY47368.1 two-component sensor histidine kinase [Lentzea sp. NBRC 102530]
MISLQWWRGLDVRVQDAPIALALAVGSAIPALYSKGTQLGELPTRPFDWLAIVVIAVECLPLVFRRKWPLICLALVSVAFSVDQLRGYHTVAGTALAVALISAGLHLERHRRATVIGASVAYVGLALALDAKGSTEGVAGFVTFYLALAAAWAIGAWLRLSRSAEAERRRHVAAATRVAERTLIARELHDVVTHHVTAMVVQAEAARYLSAAPDKLDRTLQAITDTGRRSLTDLRHLLDLLNPDHSPERVGDLRTLVEQTRLAGQPVEFAEEGEATGDAGSAEAVAYRVVQEALTNALKYAHGNATNVYVRYGERDITVEVGTEGAASSSPVGGGGRGLAGLRERVDVLGGEFSAGRRDGGFVVKARIPAGNPA